MKKHVYACVWTTLASSLTSLLIFTSCSHQTVVSFSTMYPSMNINRIFISILQKYVDCKMQCAIHCKYD